MDASSASHNVQTDFNVCSFFLQIQNSSYPTILKPTNTVIKYTKLPDFDFDSKVQWPQKDSYILQPRLRRIAALNDQDDILGTSRSLKTDLGGPMKLMTSSYPSRKVVTIAEDEPKSCRPVYSKAIAKKPEHSAKSNRSSGTDIPHAVTRYTTPRPTSTPRYLKKQETKTKTSAKPINNSSRTTNSRSFGKSKTNTNGSVIHTMQVQQEKSRVFKERDNVRSIRSISIRNKTSISKNVAQPSVSEKESNLLKNKLTELIKNDTPQKLPGDLSRVQKNTRKSFMPNIKPSCKAPIIHVPLDVDKNQISIQTEITQYKLEPIIEKVDSSTTTYGKNVNVRDIDVGTDPEPKKVDVITGIENEAIQNTDSDNQTDYFLAAGYESLDIPNVTLCKEKCDMSKDEQTLSSQSLPNLKIPTLKINTRKEEQNSRPDNHCSNPSYIIGRATVTYTTRQKIDFHVLDSKNNPVASHLCSVSTSPMSYPMNVVSVLKKEIDKKDVMKSSVASKMLKKKEKYKPELLDCLNEMKSLNCSYFESSKLVKPSEIISTISVNSGLLQREYICEQFQRELDFIDSFFESLQYLESCSLSDKGFANKQVENWVSKSGFDIKNPEYDTLFSKLENGTNMDDTETMASKSLCLLNLLIRDEQRRAKNLLFVLKMREDALKDFTKSQILWLENKKKQDNTDIPTLKKKQRGALLKLQHECGEMQRMRKALLALSQKRKVALMKTKKNIELKLKNNVAVDQILLSKKKLKRNSVNDRSAAPLKCFELSSSGCEESFTSRAKSESALVGPELLSIECTEKGVEKSIQTGDSLIGSLLVDHSTDTAAENYVTVDGGYLNILFSNLSLPEIFSSGKHYEVNEEALKSIVASSNRNHNAMSQSDLIEKFIDQIKNERSTTPSTARSLVEEFDQYYKVLAEEEKTPQNIEAEVKDSETNVSTVGSVDMDSFRGNNAWISESDSGTQLEDMNSSCNMSIGESLVYSVPTQVRRGKDSASTGSQAGPLPVPAGAAAIELATSAATSATLLTPLTFDSHLDIKLNSSIDSFSAISDEVITESVSALAGISITPPSHAEAEELRRQQLAIEREIKALEQQQCQLIVVREIPDKPPPPYTPPAENRLLKIPRLFLADDTIEEKVHRSLTNSITVSIEPTDAFDIYLQDFCQESVAKHKAQISDKPWDACNLLPQKPPLNVHKLVQKTATEVREILTGASPTFVSGVGARRADHIDEILFAEWRRCEPEWTALHLDEAHVKRQIFEGIFQKILTETIDEYKKTVLNSHETDGDE